MWQPLWTAKSCRRLRGQCIKTLMCCNAHIQIERVNGKCCTSSSLPFMLWSTVLFVLHLRVYCERKMIAMSCQTVCLELLTVGAEDTSHQSELQFGTDFVCFKLLLLKVIHLFMLFLLSKHLFLLSRWWELFGSFIFRKEIEYKYSYEYK